MSASVFTENETIFRFIYSPYNYQPNTKRLKPNFLKFDYNTTTSRLEMSCNRLFLERDIAHVKELGKYNAAQMNRETFVGVARTNMKAIWATGKFSIVHTPDWGHPLQNYSHCDLCLVDLQLATVDGKATSAEYLLFRSEFVSQWDFVSHNDVGFSLQGLQYQSRSSPGS